MPCGVWKWLGLFFVLRFSWALPGSPHDLTSCAVRAELVDAGVLVPVGQEDEAVVRLLRDAGRLVERPGALADAVVGRHASAREPRRARRALFLGVVGVRGLALLAQLHERLAVLVELADPVVLVAQDVDRVVRVDPQAVGHAEVVLAPGVDELAVLVEHHVRVLGAGVDVDVVLGIDGDAGALAPAPALGELAPVWNQLVLALPRVNDSSLNKLNHRLLLRSIGCLVRYWNRGQGDPRAAQDVFVARGCSEYVRRPRRSILFLPAFATASLSGGPDHMHVPDGYLAPAFSMGMGLLTVPSWVIASQKRAQGAEPAHACRCWRSSRRSPSRS